MKQINDLDYIDDEGHLHIMCACGHTVSGSVKVGDKIPLCPNCRWSIKFGYGKIVYPDRLPLKETPDEVKE